MFHSLVLYWSITYLLCCDVSFNEASPSPQYTKLHTTHVSSKVHRLALYLSGPINSGPILFGGLYKEGWTNGNGVLSTVTLRSVKRPYYELQQNGSLIVKPTMPPVTQVFPDWDSLLVEEMNSWDDTSNSADKIMKRHRKLTRAEELDKRILEMRRFSQEEELLRSPKQPPRLWIVRPKRGNYCELMKRDPSRLNSLVHRIRRSYTQQELEIVNVTMDVDMPLCEVFFSGPISEEIRIFYARGGTLQVNCVSRFWSRCEVLSKDKRLFNKYGGEACPGLFPLWDEDGMIDELHDCMNPPPTRALETRLNWGWHNPGALTPENEEERESWYQNVHWPTRLAVQRAFENGVEDYRTIIMDEYAALQEADQFNAEHTQM